MQFCGTAATPATAAAAAVDAGAKLTDAVVATFAGSRITSTRLVDHAHDAGDALRGAWLRHPRADPPPRQPS